MQHIKNEIKEGTLRLMTLGEIAMARKIFSDSLIYSRVWIHCGSYFPFGLQAKNVAMAPNGELWFRKEPYHRDFSDIRISIAKKHIFIHELAHVWQHQHGQWVRMRGLMSWAADYYYRLDKASLRQYNLEQQASIIADYWLLSMYGIDEWFRHQNPNLNGKYCGRDNIRDIPALYRKIITGKNT